MGAVRLVLVTSNKAPARRPDWFEALDYATPEERARVFVEAGIACESEDLQDYMKAKCELGQMFARAERAEIMREILGLEKTEDLPRAVQTLMAQKEALKTETDTLLEMLRTRLSTAESGEECAFLLEQISSLERHGGATG